MCGISGILHFNARPVSVQDLKRMTDAIIHRGPDGEGHWVNADQRVGFGHRRLSIIDLSENARQPMHYANGRYTITFNGEIYNYVELKAQLSAQGHRFVSGSDTEVLLAMYHQYGEACLSHLDGMFAFAIWDEKEQILFCARDRFGEKPFYYSFSDSSGLYFASEMKALWAAGISRSKDPKMVNHYLRTGNVTMNENVTTFYADIKQLEAAHYMIMRRDSKPVIRCYYSINTGINEAIGEKEAVDGFSDLFASSIRLRLRSDVPVGSSLSGGLDSSSIVMMIDRLKEDGLKQNTFSARFKGHQKDEGEHIHKVIAACRNVVGHEVFPDGEQMQEVFEKLVYHQEEPFASASMFAQWKVMELAKQHGVTVLLDGQGADEYLAGYLPYYGTYFKQLFFTDRKKYETEFAEFTALRGNAARRVEADETVRMKLGRLKRKLFGQPMPYNKMSLSAELKQHTQSVGLKELLRYADRNAMAHSREVRLPFLSHKLVDYVFQLPDHYKLRNGFTKYILRKSMEQILPPSICWRVDKIGYEPPQADWIKGEFWKAKIAEGKRLHRQLAGEQGPERNDWQYLMTDSFLKS